MANDTHDTLTIVRDLAARGFPIFPIQPNEKRPIEGERWRGLICRNVDAAIAEWSRPNRQNCNVAVACGEGLLVVDVDEGKVPGALDAYNAFGLPRTFSVRTPSGGFHFYFVGPDVRNRVGTLAPGIDLRSAGGYVVAPGSHTRAGSYDLLENIPLANAPDEFVVLCGRKGEKMRPDQPIERREATEADRRGGVEVLAQAIERVRDAPTGKRNDTLNKAAFDVGRHVWDGWISFDDAMSDLSAAALAAGLDEEEIDRTLNSGFTAAQTATPPTRLCDIFGDVYMPDGCLDTALVTSSLDLMSPLAIVNLYDALATPAPDRKWLVHKLIPCNQVTLLYGDGGTGKSLLALMLAISVTSGAAWVGHSTFTGPVLYFSAEDDLDENKRRAACILERLRLDRTQLQHQLVLADLAAEDATLAHFDREDRIHELPLFNKLLSRIKEVRPVLVVIDNLADVFGGDEIKKAHVRPFVTKLRSICKECDTTLVVLAHPSQSGMASGKGTSGNSAWSNSVRSRLFLQGDDAKEKKDKDVRVLHVMKANYAETGATTRMKWMNWCFDCVAAAAIAEAEAKEATAAEVKVMEMLTAALEHGVKLSMSSTSASGYPPTVFAKDPSAAPYRKNALDAAFRSLCAKGRIVGARDKTVIRPVLSNTSMGNRFKAGDLFE